MCTTDGKWKWNGAQCAVTFHNPSFWGLALSDVHLHKIKRKSGVEATDKSDDEEEPR
jgi:hypothetical protein